MISYWEKTALLKPRDLIIIGGGIVGMRSALEYKKIFPEADVLILERGILPGGASTRNAGFACFGSVTELIDDSNQHGTDAAFDLVNARYQGLQLLRTTMGDEAIGFSMPGGYELFTDKSIFEEAVSRIPEFNARLEGFTGEPEMYTATEFEGYMAIHTKQEGYLHSGKLVKQLGDMVRKNGIELWNNCEVQSCSKQAVRLKDGLTLEATNVLAATNAFTRHLLSEVSIKPARGYVCVTKPISHLWKGTFHFDKGYIYFRDLGDRILIGGGRNKDFKGEETTEMEINPVIKNYIHNFLSETLRLGDTWEAEYEWPGIMGFGDSKMPIIRKTEEGIFVAAGLGGMGVALGMETARRVAGLIAESR